MRDLSLRGSFRLFLTGVTILTLSACALMDAAGIGAQNTAVESLDDLLAQYVDTEGPAVVLLISSPEGGTEAAALGYADINREVPAEPGDSFRIASISKTWVAATALSLVEGGLLDLDAPITTYLDPGVSGSIPYSQSITVRQLMNMTSGVADYLDNEDYWLMVDNDPSHLWSADEVIPYAYSLEPYFAPGEGYAYSNTNLILLQFIMEGVSGQPLADLLDKAVIDPLGLNHTYLEHYGTPSSQGLSTRSYVQDNKGQWQDVTDINDGQGLADGGLISTVGDMAIFIRALINGEVIGDLSWKEMTSYVDDGFGEGYGLGIGTYTTAYGTGIGHDGTSSGYASELWYWPDYDLVIAILYGSEDLQADLSETLIDAALGYVTQ